MEYFHFTYERLNVEEYPIKNDEVIQVVVKISELQKLVPLYMTEGIRDDL